MAIERSEGPFITGIEEFKYSSDNLPVRQGQEYLINYMTNKTVRYVLSVSNAQIYRKQKTAQEQYRDALKTTSREVYPKKLYPTSVNLPFDNKIIVRHFAKSVVDKNPEIFEVVSPTQTTLYTFVSLEWQISGPVSQAEQFNTLSLEEAESSFPGITEILPPLQLHKSKLLETVERATNITTTQTQQTQQTEPTGPPPGVVTGGAGGGGGY